MAKVKAGDIYYFRAMVTRVNEDERSRSITFRVPSYGTPITILESALESSLEDGSMVKDDARRR